MPARSSMLRLAVFTAGLCWLMPVGAGGPAVHVVRIDSMAFVLAVIEVRAGDTVTWKNSDPFPHNVSVPRKFTSPEIPAGGAWTFKATEKGSFTYICTLHPTMTGRLVVK